MRTFAFEAGAFVLSSVQYLHTAGFPQDFPLREELAGCPDVHLLGGSLVCDPWGNLLAGPAHGGEEILYANCDSTSSSRPGACSTPRTTTTAQAPRRVERLRYAWWSQARRGTGDPQ